MVPSTALEILENSDFSVCADFKPSLHPCAIETYHCSSNEGRSSNCQSHFLCGHYELDEMCEGGASRGGSISICTVDLDRTHVTHSSTECQSGVLDMKVSGNFVASAQAEHSLFLHRIRRDLVESNGGNDTESQTSLKLEEVASVSDVGEGLFLSVDWNLGYSLDTIQECATVVEASDRSQKLRNFVRRKAIHDSGESSVNIAVSTQSGSVIVYELSSEREFSEIFKISEIHTMMGEAMPVWIVCFDPHDKNILVTGGDDCTMKLWDLRQGSTSTHVNRRHGAGVTSAQWHPTQEHVFATGSYDEHCRVWDNRILRTPVAEIHAGGGVWRTKWCIVSEESSFLFLSCMQGGSCIVEYEHSACTCAMRMRQSNESSPPHLAYGIDLLEAHPVPAPTPIHSDTATDEDTKEFSSGRFLCGVTVATCSFYDNLVQVWSASL